MTAAEDGDGLVGIAQSEDEGEDLSRTDESGCDINGEEHKDDDCTDIPEESALVPETVGEEGGKGQGVLGDLGVDPESLRDEEPCSVGTDGETDSDPDLSETGCVYRSGKSHEKPAAHIRSLCGKCGDVGVEGTSAEDVIRQVR